MEKINSIIYFVFPILALFFVAFLIKKSKPDLDKLPYQKKLSLLTPAEKYFFEVLKTAINDRFYIFPQINLNKILLIDNHDKEFYTYRNKINQKSIDFLLCDKLNLSPILAIELDDSSHNEENRQDRDKFVNQAFADANLPLLRIPVKSNYDIQELVDQINEKISK